jgi:hypothetical protein
LEGQHLRLPRALDIELLGQSQSVSVEGDGLFEVVGFDDQAQLPNLRWRLLGSHHKPPLRA